MNTLVYDNTGLLHLISATAALISGTCVLFMNKGTKIHRQIGYGYVFSMILLNITAFGIYRLFHRFGPFHIAAVVSSVTLLMGFIPAFFRKPASSWIYYHVFGMYYSVVGLYAAFVSEVVVRIPGISFAISVTIATMIVMAAGIAFIQVKKKSWLPKVP